MLKKTAVNSYLLSVARVAYVLITFSAVLAVLALLNIGGL
jgi:hypothetical protein